MEITKVIKYMKELQAKGETDVGIAWWDRQFSTDTKKMDKDEFAGLADQIDDLDWSYINEAINELIQNS